MNELKKKYFINEILKIKRGNARGVPINAKPFFILSIIDSIQNGILKRNVISYPNKEIEQIYYDLFLSYEPWRVASPFFFPFFHMTGESFYEIKWEKDKFVPSSHAHSPSGKFLANNVEFAYLDTDLWELLQDYNVRDEFRKLIINYYIKPKQD